MYQGFEAYIHSLLAILEKKDYERALRLAEEAQELGTVSTKFPGASKSRATLEANVAVCELLAGNNGQERFSRLDIATKRLPGVSPAIPAWALAEYYRRAGRPDKAEAYLSTVKRLLPHSVLLNETVRC
jgi:hypothetical protein